MESLDENFVLKTVTQMLRKVMSKKWTIPEATRIIRYYQNSSPLNYFQLLHFCFLPSYTILIWRELQMPFLYVQILIDFSRTTWYSNKHFKGSYSFISVKAETNNVSASSLSAPINNSRGDPVRIVLFVRYVSIVKKYNAIHFIRYCYLLEKRQTLIIIPPCMEPSRVDGGKLIVSYQL